MKKAQGYFLYFMFYSIIGWLYEVFLEVVYTDGDFPTEGYCLDLTVLSTGLAL